MDAIISAMALEIKIQKNYLDGESIKTIYFGGGTPSILPLNHIECLLSAIHKNFKVDNRPEVTIEANPDDLDPEKLASLTQLGFNRLSIGIQSFNDNILQSLNRVHTAKEGLKSVEIAKNAGFDNINIDIIFAIPTSTHALLASDLATAVELGVQHISAYALTIEPRTVFGNWLKRKKFIEADEEFSAKQFLLCLDMLTQAGYEHYEISNYARPGFHSKHNSSYWSHEKYLGIGPGAHAFNGVARQFNVSNNHLYRKALDSGELPCEKEKLSPLELANEYLMMSLRTCDGCDLQKLRFHYGYDMHQLRHERIEQLIRDEFLIMDKDRLALTRKGKLLVDSITADLFWA
jgi:oxygen-independent coproporphyrinogen-3 oxidase